MADKKISELPLIQNISGSTVVVPMVHDGTTIQIPIERLSLFTSQFSATTASNTFIGNQTINGNVVITGKLTAQEMHTELTSASIIFESGSSLFGNSGDDTHTFTGSILTTGSIILNGSAIGTGQLNVQTASQDLVNRGISSVTGSINTTTSSFDSVFLQISSTTGSINTTTSSFNSVFLGISSVTGAINTTTSSFDSVFLGISSFTGSLNSLTGSYATTGSNTFRANQAITGSLSISAGEFNVTTGSGNMTSSLIFDHTQNDGVTLGLRHNDRLSVADHTFNVNVWAAGVYTTFVRNGTPYSILNVEAFDDNKIYLYRDTRLYNKSLVIDNNLIVQQGVVIGSGSLLVNGVITGSILATNGVVSSSNQLFELNQQTGSQSNLNAQIGIATASLNFTTGALNSFTGSVIGQTNTISTFTSSVNFATQSLNTQTGSQDLVNRGISSVTGSINTTTSSFNSVFSQIGSTTSSLIGITNGLMAFTAALDSTYATDAQLYQLYQATASIHSTTASLNIQTGSQDLVNRGISSVTGSINTTTSSFNSVFLGISSVTGAMNTQSSSQDLVNLGISSVTGSLIGITNGLMAFTAALDSTYATDAQLYQLYQATASIHFTTQSLNTQTGSQDIVNFNISVVTSSIDSHILKQATQTGSQDLVNLGISTFTGSLRSEVNLIEAYTASLKGAAIVSSSQQITNYYKFAETASANTFYGNQSISGSVGVNKSSNGGSGNDFPRLKVQNSLPTQGDGSSTFNFADILISSGNEAVNMFLATTYAAGSWAPSGIINVATNHGLQIKTNNTTALNIASGGDVTVSTGNLVIGTAGKGIDFSITSNSSGTMTSELLNDYEEGTWTPTFTASTSGTITVNSGATVGNYTKIGRQVTVNGTFTVTSVSSPLGEWRIQGLPFTSAAGAGARTAVSVLADTLETTATTSIVGYVDPSVTYITLYKYAAGAVSAMAADVKAGSYVFVTATYFV
jgi:hypothetical protein